MNASMVAVLKLLGSVMVIAAGGIAGFYVAGRLESRLREMRRLETALVFLSSEITYSLTPLPQALFRAGERAGGAVGALFCRFGELTGLAQRRDPSEALDAALSDSGSAVPAEAVDLLFELSRNLGTFGHKEQARFIEMSIDKAGRMRGELEGECRAKAKLARYLGLLGGACVAIVLL